MLRVGGVDSDDCARGVGVGDRGLLLSLAGPWRAHDCVGAVVVARLEGETFAPPLK